MQSKKSRFLFKPVFFLLCYLYIWIFVKPHLIYHGFGTVIPDVPLFSTGWRFLRDSLDVPGGLVLYVHGFLSQWYYYSPLGALIVVLAAWCLAELSKQHFISVGRPRSTVLQYFPAVMILLAYNQYNHPLAACLASGAGLLFSFVLEKTPLRRAPIRMVAFCLASAVTYCLAGAGGVLVFSLMTTVYLLFLRRDWLSAVFTLPAAGAVVWILAEYVFYMSPKQALTILTPFAGDSIAGMKMLSKVSIIMLYAFVPLTVSLICLWKMLFGRAADVSKARPGKARKKTRAVARPRRASLAYAWRLAMPVVPIAVLVAGLSLGYDKTHKQIVLMNYHSRQKQWPEVLELGNKLPKNIYNIYCNHDINRALYHADRLGYDMLCYPQNPHALLLTHEEDESSMTQLKMCDAFLELGNVDYAEKLASEFLVVKGDVGTVIERLAWINLIKGQQDTARIYLNALKKDLIYRDKAESMLSGIDNGFAPDEAAYIRRVNSHIRSNGNARLNRESIEEMLTGLLEQNPHNKMAFEYLMACYLLSGQVAKIATSVESFGARAYRDVPTLYAEAALIHYGVTGQQRDLNKLNIKPQTARRFKQFVQLCNSMQALDRRVVLERLVGEFGTSYFFYFYHTFTAPGLQGTNQG